MIVITGATGTLGSKTIQALLTRVPAAQLAVSVRDPERAGNLLTLGVRARQADFSDPDALRHAFEGACQVLLVSSGVLGEAGVHLHRNVAEAARDAGARRVVYTSHMAASPQSHFPPMWTHAATEAMLAQTGLAFTALRNGFYASSALQLMGNAAQSGVIAAPQDGPVSWTTHDDLALAAATVLTDEGRYDGPTPPLVADEALTLEQLGELLGRLAGHPVRREVIPAADHRQVLQARGLPADRIETVMGLYAAAARQEFLSRDRTLGTLLGRAPTTMRAVLQTMPGR